MDDCCYECGTNDDQNILLICDECGFHCCHTYCCNPPLDLIPEEDWFCRFCEENRRRPTARSSSRRTTNNNRNNERPATTERSNTSGRTTRSSTRNNNGQSLLQRLFSIADRQNDSQLIQEISSHSAESVDLDETTNQYQTESRRPTRRLNRLQRNTRNVQPSDEEEEVEEEEEVVPTRRNNRATRIGEIEEEFNSNLDDFTFSTARSRRYASRNNPNSNSNRMNIETNNEMSMEDLNTFRYPLRSHGRSNPTRID